MEISEIAEIRDDIRKYQTEKRYEHTLGVAYTAAALAFIYNEDPMLALLAGILHDSAKCYSTEEQLKIMKKYGEKVPKELLKAKKVIHAKCGAVIAKERYGVSDTDVLNSIAYHTTGRPHMSVLEKIIFTADYIEPTRRLITNLKDIRKLAFRDIDECVYRILSDTIEYLNSRDQYIYSETLGAFEWYGKERMLSR